MTSPAAFARQLRLVSGLRSIRRVRRLQADEPLGAGPVELRFRALGDTPVQVRPGKRDLRLAHEVFVKEHTLPPDQIDAGSIRTVWDLGAGIGLNSAHFAARYPKAQVIAVELHEDDAALCQTNVAPWADRCDVIHAAVHPGGRETEDSPAPTITLDSLLDLSGPSAVVDYAWMDIAGAEREVLRENTTWASRVRSIRVEVHAPYTVDDCTEDLQRLGFATASGGTTHRHVSGVRTQVTRTRASRTAPGAGQ